jgi:hypothetical protein
MIRDILNYFLLRKANDRSVLNILKKEGFIYTPQDIENILKGNQKGVRYGNIVLIRNENGQECKRFLKIVIDGTIKTFKLFRRQVEITDALDRDEGYKFPTIKVIKYSFNESVPYAIFETRENGEGFGFMNDNPQFYEKFSENDMEKLVDVIYSFHNAGLNISKNIWKYTQNISSNIGKYKNDAKKLLETVINHKLESGNLIQKPVKELIENYLGCKNLEKIVFDIFDKNWEYVNSSKFDNSHYLVHADMQIDNIYKHENGDFELLDFEWVGRSDSPIIAIMYDYGNLRARAWSSTSFQQMLDRKMLEIGKRYYKDINIINSGLVLGKLRSSLMMCRFHLDFTNTVKKDKRTEEDYRNMYPKTLSDFGEVIKI